MVKKEHLVAGVILFFHLCLMTLVQFGSSPMLSSSRCEGGFLLALVPFPSF